MPATVSVATNMEKHVSTILYRGKRQCLFYEAGHELSFVLHRAVCT